MKHSECTLLQSFQFIQFFRGDSVNGRYSSRSGDATHEESWLFRCAFPVRVIKVHMIQTEFRPVKEVHSRINGYFRYIMQIDNNWGLASYTHTRNIKNV